MKLILKLCVKVKQLFVDFRYSLLLTLSFFLQAKLVRMTHVVPPGGTADKDTWPATTALFFNKFIESETILKMVISEISNPPEVVFFECFPTVHLCVNAMLVKEGLAESTGDL